MKSTLAFILLTALGACTEHTEGVTGTQSLAIEMTAPTNTGDVNNRLPSTAHSVTVNIKALDAQDMLDTSFSATINVYAQFLGTLTPALGEQPLTTIDVQNGVVGEAYERDAIVATIGTLIDKARAADIDVVWVQHNSADMPRDSEAWQYVPELKRRDSEPLVQKEYPDSFEDTDLESVLAEHGIGRVFISGAQTDECVRSTLHGAITRGYDTTLVSDAHTTEDLSAYGAPTPDKVIAHTNLYWRFQTGPGRTAAVAETADIEFNTEA
jgi:hypothetical protein